MPIWFEYNVFGCRLVLDTSENSKNFGFSANSLRFHRHFDMLQMRSIELKWIFSIKSPLGPIWLFFYEKCFFEQKSFWKKIDFFKRKNYRTKFYEQNFTNKILQIKIFSNVFFPNKIFPNKNAFFVPELVHKFSIENTLIWVIGFKCWRNHPWWWWRHYRDWQLFSALKKIH